MLRIRLLWKRKKTSKNHMVYFFRKNIKNLLIKDQKVEEKILIVENSDAMKKKEEINLSKKDEKKNKSKP